MKFSINIDKLARLLLEFFMIAIFFSFMEEYRRMKAEEVIMQNCNKLMENANDKKEEEVVVAVA